MIIRGTIRRKHTELNSYYHGINGNSMANTEILNKCPKCSGKMYIDPGYQDEAYCMACGYVEYLESVSTGFLPNPFEYEEV
jgi:predicted  nucleic acid-binding Zn ribbon protein